MEETRNKCAYCESSVPHVDFGDCEHILPKSKRPELFVEWENLTYVCSVCNTKKSDYYDEDAPLLNPYVDDSAHLLRFAGPLLVESVHDDGRGRRTVLRLALSRPPLVEKRLDRIKTIHRLLTQWVSADSASDKDAVWSALEEETADDTEYSACVRQFVEDYLAE